MKIKHNYDMQTKQLFSKIEINNAKNISKLKIKGGPMQYGDDDADRCEEKS